MSIDHIMNINSILFMSWKLKYQKNYINMRYYINLQISICIFIINICL